MGGLQQLPGAGDRSLMKCSDDEWKLEWRNLLLLLFLKACCVGLVFLLIAGTLDGGADMSGR